LSNVLSVAQRAATYAKSGAVMISVLVDKPFFGGSYENLATCRETLDTTYGPSRPRLLCKEFILDPVQIEWAASAGADAVLLIAKIVTAEELRSFVKHAHTRGLEPLVEVTTFDELQTAQAAGARVIGVNARDLDTLVMDHARAANVLAHIDAHRIRVHLSGLVLPDDVARIARSPADAALIGEALMRQDNPTALLSEMVKRSADKP
jgi:indole-3-glycerol phosphate synthase